MKHLLLAAALITVGCVLPAAGETVGSGQPRSPAIAGCTLNQSEYFLVHGVRYAEWRCPGGFILLTPLSLALPPEEPDASDQSSPEISAGAPRE